MTYHPIDLLDIPDPWPQVDMEALLTANLIPEHFAELARQGVFYESKLLA